MAKDYIPTKDADFSQWLSNFSTKIVSFPGAYGLTAPDSVAIEGANLRFQEAYTGAVTPATRTTAAIVAKDVARAEAELIVRPFAVNISLNNAVPPANKEDVGVTVRSATRTPVPAPVDAPNLGVQSMIPGQLTAGYNVVGNVGKAKPDGAVGVEIVQSVGTVFATDPGQCSLLGTFTKSPFRVGYGVEDSGKKVTVFARFVTRGGPGGRAQVGPWGAPLQFVAM